MRAYAVYEHPEFTLSEDSISTLRQMAKTLTVVAASGAAVYGIVTSLDVKTGLSIFQ